MSICGGCGRDADDWDRDGTKLCAMSPTSAAIMYRCPRGQLWPVAFRDNSTRPERSSVRWDLDVSGSSTHARSRRGQRNALGSTMRMSIRQAGLRPTQRRDYVIRLPGDAVLEFVWSRSLMPGAPLRPERRRQLCGLPRSSFFRLKRHDYPRNPSPWIFRRSLQVSARYIAPAQRSRSRVDDDSYLKLAKHSPVPLSAGVRYPGT